MNDFRYIKGELHCENVAIKDIVSAHNTPCYIYSHAALVRQWHAFDDAFDTRSHQICYAVKANSNIGVLNVLAQMGSGFDIVSGGELERVVKAGGSPSKVVFSGVGKQADEIKLALKKGIYCFNVESEAELHLIEEIATHFNVQAPIALRVNPDVDAQSHPYISTGLKENKFGVDSEDALRLYQYADKSSHLTVKGIACHIGSQLTTLAPFIDAVQRLLFLVKTLKENHILISHIDVGGGLGVRYQHETPPTISEYANALLAQIQDPQLTILLQPGRAIAASAGILVTKVIYLKLSGNKRFCIVDCAMNDFIRPALYQGWHDIIPVKKSLQMQPLMYDVVGPVCESGDFLAKDRTLSVASGDLLAICNAGAYGFVTSSNYNSRPRIAEVMVKNNEYKLIRKRESIEALFQEESIW
ncbi:MAG: diaminopimelate decarboxylase [Gammaproteobacteria bacterium]|jgi:diaminopimelate decarboxylase|nr:diaminopimelate decarboxylase [Gammaproteobacteria bacterium]